MSHSRKGPSFFVNVPAKSSAPSKGPNFFLTLLPIELLQHSSEENSVFEYLDQGSKAKLARSSRLFASLPEYQSALRNFNMLTKIFFEFVLAAQQDEVLLMLERYPELHFATAEFIDEQTGEKFKRTAYQLALAAENVGKKGCDLCLCEDLRESSSLDNLYLSSDGDNQTPFKYLIQGEVKTIARGDYQAGQLQPKYFDILKNMYKSAAFIFPKVLNLSSEALQENQQHAYSALLKITFDRGHTLFVKENGMAQEIEKSATKCARPKLQIAKLTQEQFTPGWERQREERAMLELKALEVVTKAINDSQENIDCAVALREFKNVVKLRISKIGTQFNGKLLSQALNLWINIFWYAQTVFDSRKNILFIDEVLTYLIQIAPTNYQQDLGQLLRSKIVYGEKSVRTFRFSNISWKGKWTFVAANGGMELEYEGHLMPELIDKYLQAKTAALQTIVQPHVSLNQDEGRRCCVVQ
jgi:hypothetical protein